MCFTCARNISSSTKPKNEYWQKSWPLWLPWLTILIVLVFCAQLKYSKRAWFHSVNIIPLWLPWLTILGVSVFCMRLKYGKRAWFHSVNIIPLVSSDAIHCLINAGKMEQQSEFVKWVYCFGYAEVLWTCVFCGSLINCRIHLSSCRERIVG